MRILVVDDVPELLIIWNQILTELGHHCTLISTIENAMAALDQTTFDFLLTDFEVGPYTAERLLIKWLAQAPHRPSLIFTGNPVVARRKCCLLTTAIIEKPNWELAVEIIRNQLS